MDFILPLLSISVIAILCVLGFLVIRKHSQKGINLIFLLLIFCSILWIFFNFAIDISGNLKHALFFSKLTIIGPILWAPLVLYFSFIFPEERKASSIKKIIFIFFPALIALCFVPTHYNVAKVWQESWGIDFQPGILYSVLIFYLAVYFALTIKNFISSYLHYQGTKKTQITYVLSGFLSTLILGIFMNAILPLLGYSQLVSVGPSLSLILFASFTSYVILKHRFLDIRIIIRQSIVYGLSLGSVIAITVSSVLGVAYFAKVNVNYWTLAIGLVLGTLLFDPVKRSFQSFANKYLFTSLYNYQATIRALSQELTTTIDFGKIISYLNQIMQETMHVEKMAVLIKDQNSAHYNAHKIFGFNKKEAELWPIFNLITEYFKKDQALIVQEEMEAEASALAKTMQKEELAIALPLVRGEKLIGAIILGEKISADSYSEQDIELLEVLANQASIAIENALLYKEVQDFTLHLQERVNSQTADIKKLYAVKNDFLHIVSHQLRTPLTALNGLASLLTDKDYEAQSEEEKNKIKERIKISCDRLSGVTNRMLDTLNFEKGRIILKLEKVDLGKSMQETVDTLKPNFEKRGLYLRFKLPEKPFFIKADPKYLSQVFQNLIDNAEKYTREGGLTIQIRKDPKEAKIIFKDTGIGLDAEEKKYALAEKFFRGRGAKEQYTGGTGLGLYLAKQIIDGHHGKIEVSSAGRDQGTEFIVSLPIK